MTGEECSIEEMGAAPSIEHWLNSKLDTTCGGFNISPAGMHFISRCLTLQPSDRITAAQAVHHEWFTAHESDHVVFSKMEEGARAGWTPREVI